MNFQNQNLKEIIKAVNNARADFEHRRKGRILRGILFGLGEVYPEDKRKIFALFQEGKTQKPEIQTGGAKITRKKDETPATKKVGDCDGCGGTTLVPTTEQKKKRDKVEPEPQEYDIDITSLTSVEDVLDRFEGRASAILAFAQAAGVEIPANVKKAKTAANYIVTEAKNRTAGQNQKDEEE